MRVIQHHTGNNIKQCVTIIEKCPDTGLYVSHIPEFPGAHSQGSTLDELNANMQEVLEMLMESVQ